MKSRKSKACKNTKGGSSSASESSSSPNRVLKSPYFEHVELWTLRILTEFRFKIYDPWASDKKIWLTVAGFNEKEISENDDQYFMAKIEERLSCGTANQPERNGVLFRNIEYVSDILQLNEIECEIFTFISVTTRNLYLRKAIKEVSVELKELIVQLLACALGKDETVVRIACKKESTLVEAGFLFRHHSWRTDVERWLTLEDAISNIMFTEHSDMESFTSSFFKITEKGSLTTNDYPHLGPEIKMMQAYLKEAVDVKLQGVNILIYGSPGTGKTELAKLLSAETGMPLYEVTSEDADEYSSSDIRLTSYKMCQSFLSKSRNGFVLFDEMEDIFPSESTAFGGKAQKFMACKAQTNFMLESNLVPTIWLSNEVHYLDPAYLRRFDLAVEMKIPPRSARKAIVERYLKDFNFPSAYLDQLAEIENLPPAQIERAAKVIRHCGSTSIQECRNALDLIIKNSLNLLGHSSINRKKPDSNIEFELNYLNVDIDVDAISRGLEKHPTGRFCLYGPPGTGKTSFGVYLSKELDRPLMVRRASDIFDMYVGGTEKNIARIFNEASQEGAILMIDEADSLLQDRKGASRSWEVTQVNELLTQMENFQGILICSTNLMQDIDQASLRRFDFKVFFDYMEQKQRWKLFVKHLLGYGSDLSNIAREKLVIDRLHALTPGDFAVARRQFEVFNRKPTPMEFSAILEKECKAKPGVSTTMGFI